MGFSSSTERSDRARPAGRLADAGAGWLDRACARLPFGLLLLQSDLTVCAQLGRALPAHLPVRLEAGRLVLPTLILRRVRLLLAADSAAGPALIRVHETGATAVTLVFERVSGDATFSLWTARVFAEDGLMPTSEALRLTYRMTLSEAGVVRQLVAGQCLRAAALHLRISHETARSHLRGAFLKANVRCQAALVARVLSGPAIALG